MHEGTGGLPLWRAPPLGFRLVQPAPLTRRRTCTTGNGLTDPELVTMAKGEEGAPAQVLLEEVRVTEDDEALFPARERHVELPPIPHHPHPLLLVVRDEPPLRTCGAHYRYADLEPLESAVWADIDLAEAARPAELPEVTNLCPEGRHYADVLWADEV